MKNTFKIVLLLTLAMLLPTTSNAQKATRYKCMIQMTNYMGEGAYIIISLVDAKGNYEKTLYVLGQDKKMVQRFKRMA